MLELFIEFLKFLAEFISFVADEVFGADDFPVRRPGKIPSHLARRHNHQRLRFQAGDLSALERARMNRK